MLLRNLFNYIRNLLQMANKTITQLDPAAALDGTEELALWQSSATVKADVADIVAFVRNVDISDAAAGRALIATDAGKYIHSTDGSLPDFTLDDGVFAAGDVVTIINGSSQALTVTPQLGMTLYFGAVAPGVRTVASRQIATIVFVAHSEAYMVGNGIT